MRAVPLLKTAVSPQHNRTNNICCRIIKWYAVSTVGFSQHNSCLFELYLLLSLTSWHVPSGLTKTVRKGLFWLCDRIPESSPTCCQFSVLVLPTACLSVSPCVPFLVLGCLLDIIYRFVGPILFSITLCLTCLQSWGSYFASAACKTTCGSAWQ